MRIAIWVPLFGKVSPLIITHNSNLRLFEKSISMVVVKMMKFIVKSWGCWIIMLKRLLSTLTFVNDTVLIFNWVLELFRLYFIKEDDCGLRIWHWIVLLGKDGILLICTSFWVHFWLVTAVFLLNFLSQLNSLLRTIFLLVSVNPSLILHDLWNILATDEVWNVILFIVLYTGFWTCKVLIKGLSRVVHDEFCLRKVLFLRLRLFMLEVTDEFLIKLLFLRFVL